MAHSILATYFVLWAASLASAQCLTPKYEPVQDFINAQTGRGITEIVLSPDDFTLNKLLCLGRRLTEDHKTWTDVTVQIFDSRESVGKFVPGLQITSGRLLRAQLLIQSQRTSLTLNPLGAYGGEAWETTIDVREADTARCRFELNGRCLLAMDPIAYPLEALRNDVRGIVTLTARVNRDGRVSNIGVVERNARTNAALVRAAIENLKSWWLEPRQRQDSVRITYEYSVDRALRPEIINSSIEEQILKSTGTLTNVRMSLQLNRIIVTGNLPEEGTRPSR